MTNTEMPAIIRQLGAHRREAAVTFGYVKKDGTYTLVSGHVKSLRHGPEGVRGILLDYRGDDIALRAMKYPAGATEPNWIEFKLPQIEAGERVRAERKAANAAENARIRKAGAAQTAQEAAERVADLFTDRRPATAQQVAYAHDLCRRAAKPRTHQELAEMSQSAIDDLIGDLRDAQRGLCPRCGDQTTNPGLCSNCT